MSGSSWQDVPVEAVEISSSTQGLATEQMLHMRIYLSSDSVKKSKLYAYIYTYII